MALTYEDALGNTVANAAACPGFRRPTEKVIGMLFGDIRRGLDAYRATPRAILVDVREADEFASGHIPGAVNVPLSAIAAAVFPKDAPLFLYCLRGTRSMRAAGILKRMGYEARSIGGIASYRGEVT